MLERICEEIEPFDKLDLLSKVAALQLASENAERAIRLEAIVHAVASQSPTSNQTKISLSHLRRLCNGRHIVDESIVLAEDPCDNMFTEAFTFHGGSYIVFPGIVEEPTFILRNLAKALFLVRNPFPSIDFHRNARTLFVALLAISDAIAKRAGLNRRVEPVSRPGENVVVPSTKELQKLMRAVTFQEEELEQLLRRRGLSPDVLEPLVVDAGAISVGDYEISNSPLNAQPLVRIKGNIVVAQPGILLATLRHQILKMAIESGHREEVVRHYRAAVWDSIEEALNYFKLEPVKLPVAPATDEDPFADGLFVLDTNKALYVQLIVDDLSDYPAQEVFGSWQNGGIVPVLEKRQRDVEASLFSKTPAPNEALVLVLLQGVGRQAVFGFDQPLAPFRSHRLIMSAGALETIALAEGGDPLVLLKYARAQDRVRESTSVLSTNPLDEFQMYRKNDYSYYISDEARPTHLSVVPGFAGEIRREVARKRDRHGAPSYNLGYITEVTCLYDPDVPVYIPFGRLGERATVLVEELPVDIWVIGPEYEDDEQRRLHSIYAQLTDVIAYWLWQCTPALSQIMDPLVDYNRCIIIQLELTPGDDWFSISDTEVNPPEEGGISSMGVTTDPAEGRIFLKLSSPIIRSFIGADNAGERIFMQTVFRAIWRLTNELGDRPHSQVDERVIQTMLDTHMPLGIKKKLLVFSSHQVPQLDTTGLPSFRRVKHADENNLLDEMGEYLTSHGWKVGPIRDSERIPFLNEHVVPYLFKRLENLVSTLSPRGLLPWLVAHHESITRELFFTRLTIPTRLACFSHHEELVRSLSNELPDIHAVALAARFLIEYVTAQPPNGLRPMSLDVYDQLVAISSQIVNWAFDSDMIYYSIPGLEVSILPSGRVGIDREKFLKARLAYLSEYAEGEIGRASRGFRRHWRKLRGIEEGDTKSKEGNSTDDAEKAARAEFGLSFTEIGILFGDLYKLGEEQPSAVKILTLGDLTQRLLISTGWAKEKVEAGLTFLSLEPRKDFFSPAPPFDKVDVYPWRYNRSLSYIRRPLLKIKSKDGTRVLWGNRHLMHAFDYLLALCFGGRLKAHSSEMKSLMSRFHRESGDAFNDLVADMFESMSGIKVRRRLKKIGRKRIQGPDGDLGDIDVLVIDPFHHVIYVIECKDLAVARTPYELKCELDELFLGTKTKRSIVMKHNQRTQWIQANLKDVLIEFSTNTRPGWKVKPLIVVDEEIFSPYLFQSTIEVVSFQRLKEEFIPSWLAENKS